MRKLSWYRFGWGFSGGLLLFALVLGPQGRKAGVWKIKALTRSGFYYPISDSFLNPDGTPKRVVEPLPDGYLEPSILPIHNQVWIDEGNLDNGWSRVMPFYELSPVIRKYPRASYFRMTWSVSSTMGQSSFELIYNRDKGEVTETQFEGDSPGWPRTILLGKYLTDRDIHTAGQDALKNGTDFAVWATQHWDR